MRHSPETVFDRQWVSRVTETMVTKPVSILSPAPAGAPDYAVVEAQSAMQKAADLDKIELWSELTALRFPQIVAARLSRGLRRSDR